MTDLSGWSLSFTPLVPWLVLAGLGVAALVIAALLLVARRRGAPARVLALALFLLALCGPALLREARDTLPNVVAVVVDRSASQTLSDRRKQTDDAVRELAERLGGLRNVEVRTIEAGSSGTDGTALFGALQSGLSDVPPDRVGGAVLVTDGVVHDIPAQAAAIGFKAPIHALVTGHAAERDRRIALIEAPRFGIVGRAQTLRFRVIDQGAGLPPTSTVVVRRDGEEVYRQEVPVGQVASAEVQIPHGGPNIVEVQALPVENELTAANNTAVLPIDGVRDKMRVLLVSGEPHAGERTWRNLLKADANVELVHFTILRPPQKQDGTPINELSLIAFPTRQLFSEKIQDFDLIIFDRYAQEGILPPYYFENISDYVRQGGAVLLASGPDFASPDSLWGTPLADILPAEPTGQVIDGPFKPAITDLGRRHPVTRDLPGSAQTPPSWSDWFRVVASTAHSGTTVMSGADNQPLLVLSHEEKGRVAQMLSDHVWLWARGYQGGGPHADLLRRLSHWLMKEPELDEEALRAHADGNTLAIERQTMADHADPVTLTAPDGSTRSLTLSAVEPGLWRASLTADQLGLWRAREGDLQAFAAVGPANPREFQEVASTTERLKSIADATGGSVRRLESEAGIAVPRIETVSSGLLAGESWIGIRAPEASVVRGLAVWPLFQGLIGLALLIGALGFAWARESR